METKLCRACDIVKPVSEFDRAKSSYQRYLARCKSCMRKGLKMRKSEGQVKPFNKTDRIIMAGVSKSDYMNMFKMLERMGYDISRPIDEQFIERALKHHQTVIKPSKRALKQINRFLPDGSDNPHWREQKTPNN